MLIMWRNNFCAGMKLGDFLQEQRENGVIFVVPPEHDFVQIDWKLFTSSTPHALKQGIRMT